MSTQLLLSNSNNLPGHYNPLNIITKNLTLTSLQSASILSTNSDGKIIDGGGGTISASTITAGTGIFGDLFADNLDVTNGGDITVTSGGNITVEGPGAVYANQMRMNTIYGNTDPSTLSILPVGADNPQLDMASGDITGNTTISLGSGTKTGGIFTLNIANGDDSGAGGTSINIGCGNATGIATNTVNIGNNSSGTKAKVVNIGLDNSSAGTFLNVGAGFGQINLKTSIPTSITGGLRLQTSSTSTNVITLSCGDGDPNGVLSSPQGSVYLRKAGAGANTRMYINSDGSTTWQPVTSS